MTQPAVTAAVETFRARCESCARRWQARGTVNSRRAHRQAQQHSDRTGHRIEAEWANRQGADGLQRIVRGIAGS